MEDKTHKISTLEKVSYSFNSVSYSLIDGLIGTFLTIFYTDIFGLTAATIGVFFIVTRVWDAVNDPIMGMIVDRTNSRYGKFKPFLLAGSILTAVFLVATFRVVDFSYTGKVIWAYASYIGLGMAMTCLIIPHLSIVITLSKTGAERLKLVSLDKIFDSVGAVLAAGLVIPIVTMLGQGNSAAGYQYVALIFGGFLILTFVSSLFIFKEKVPPSPKRMQLKDVRGILFKNKHALVLLVVVLLRKPIFVIKIAGIAYFVKYNLGNQMLMTPLMIIFIITSIIGILLIPKLSDRTGKKNAYMISTAFMVLALLGFYFDGYENFNRVAVWMGLFGLFAVGPDVMLRGMLIDAIDYGEYITGIRSEGIIFSLLGFGNKLAGGVSGSIVVFLLSFYHYIPNVEQSAESLNGIFIINTLAPAAFSVLTILMMLFQYKFPKEEYQRIKMALDKRREQPEVSELVLKDI